MKMRLPFLLSAVLPLLEIGALEQSPLKSGCCGEPTLLAMAAKCTGASPCKSCKNCKSCGHCRSGGTCGACAPPAPTESETTIPAKPDVRPQSHPATRDRDQPAPSTDSDTVEKVPDVSDEERRAERLRLAEAEASARAERRAANLVRLGEGLESQGNRQGAREHYRRAITIAPESSVAKAAEARIRSLSSPALKRLAGVKAHRVIRAIDAQTLLLWLDGKPTAVQLIGVETPRGVLLAGSAEQADLRAVSVLDRWLEGRDVILEMDSQVPVDPFGRRSAYVYLAPDGLCVNRELVRQGVARVIDGASFQHAGVFRTLEEEARLLERGIWAKKP